MDKFLILISVFVILQRCSSSDDKIQYNEGKSFLERVDDTTLVSEERLKNNYKAMKLFSIDNDSLSRAGLYQVATNFYYLNDEDLFYQSLKILDQKSVSVGDLNMEAKTNMCIGVYYHRNFILDSAYKHYKKAKKIFTELNDQKNIGFADIELAIIQYDIGDYTGSEKSIFDALKVLKNQNGNYDVKLYNAYSLLGILYGDMYDYSKSLEYHSMGLKILETLKGVPTELQYRATSYNNIGNVYKDVGDYEAAERYFKIALNEKNLCKNYPSLYATTLDNLGYCILKTNVDNIKAYKLLNASSKLRDSLPFLKSKIISKLHLSEYYAINQDTIAALKFVDTAISLSSRKGNHFELLNSMKFAIDINHVDTKNFVKTYIRINDSIQLAERKMRNKFARIAYETDEIIVEKNTAVKHKWIILGVAGSVLVLVVLLFIIRLQRAKQLEMLLKQQQQEANENIYQLIQDQQFHIDAARRDVKQKISQELHDGVMNQLTSTRLNLFVLNKRKDEETIEKCLSLINGIQNIEREIRQVAHDLNSDVFCATNSFNNLLESLFQEQKLITSATIHTQIDQGIEWEGLDSATKMNLYRIIQEALSNCHKYAQANNIFLTIDKPEDTIHIVINDDGIGFDMKKQIKGIGLKNMNERIKTIGGTIDILAEKGKGTTIIVNLAPNNQLPITHGKKNQYYNC